MKIVIWSFWILSMAFIITFLRNHQLLSALPGMILYAATFSFASFLCKMWDRKKSLSPSADCNADEPIVSHHKIKPSTIFIPILLFLVLFLSFNVFQLKNENKDLQNTIISLNDQIAERDIAIKALNSQTAEKDTTIKDLNTFCDEYRSLMDLYNTAFYKTYDELKSYENTSSGELSFSERRKLTVFHNNLLESKMDLNKRERTYREQ